MTTQNSLSRLAQALAQGPIGAQECLPIGTPVRVGRQRGVVTDSRLLFASGCSGGQVALNTVRLTEEFRRSYGQSGKWHTLETPIERSINYSFIYRILS